MSEQTRPTCGTCPHKLGRSDAPGYCYALPYGAAEGEKVDNDYPGCIHHPDMAAYVEAWKRVREVKS